MEIYSLAVGITGLLVAILSLLEFSINIIILSSISVFIIVVLGYFLIKKKIYKKRQKFFGEDFSKVYLVFSSYWNKIKFQEDNDSYKFRYYKKTTLEPMDVMGATTYSLTGSGVAKLLCQFTELIHSKLSVKVTPLSDEDDKLPNRGTIICIGSNTTNSCAEKILNCFPSKYSLNFSYNTMNTWLHDKPYVADGEYDYAVISRIVDKEKTYFLLAGIDEEGSVAVTNYFVDSWEKFPCENFIYIYKVNKSDLSIERISGLIQKNNKWNIS